MLLCIFVFLSAQHILVSKVFHGVLHFAWLFIASSVSILTVAPQCVTVR